MVGAGFLGAAATATSPGSRSAGTWSRIRPAPFAVPQALTSVWTGKQLIVLGRKTSVSPAFDVAESYDAAAGTWKRLSPPRGPGYVPRYTAVWTGKEVLAFGAFHSVAFNPATGAWRELRRSVPDGILAWTGREAIGWGGGCCGDALANGAAYNPATGRYRALARSPLAPSQHPVGAWTGRELILLVSGFNPDGKPWPAKLARAAAYDPAANAWRRIAPLPEAGDGSLGTAVWDGRELLLVAAGRNAQSAYAYDPATNRWRPRASLPAPRRGGTAVWTGTRLVVWGGQNAGATRALNDGVAYDPSLDRWSSIPKAPLAARYGSAVAWTGRALIVWGGGKSVCDRGGVTGCHTVYVADGAAYRPAWSTR